MVAGNLEHREIKKKKNITLNKDLVCALWFFVIQAFLNLISSEALPQN